MTALRNDMLITKTDGVAGREGVEMWGLVRGATVRAKHLGTGILASLRNLVGGELKGYPSLLAGDRMGEAAAARGADAVVGFRMETSVLMNGASEIVAYGTAVRLK